MTSTGLPFGSISVVELSPVPKTGPVVEGSADATINRIRSSAKK
jgi:hypothetical protein